MGVEGLEGEEEEGAEEGGEEGEEEVGGGEGAWLGVRAEGGGEACREAGCGEEG